MEKAHKEEALGEEGPSRKQAKMEKYGVPLMTDSEKDKAERALTLFQASSGSSYNALQSDEFKRFVEILRPGFHVPSR